MTPPPVTPPGEVPTARFALATWPTPMEPAPRLSEAIGLAPSSLWLKRDDLTGLGAGGNKIRKLEWTLAAAVAEGADTVVTTGAPQSNHARLTAAAAARAGLAAVLVFPGRPDGHAPTGNLVLDDLLGATIEWAGDLDSADERTALDRAAEAVAERLGEQGRRPFIIPFGGSNATGAHGYRLAAAEISTQLAAVDHVVTAVGSGGTMAGLVAGLGARRVLGVQTGAVPDPLQRVASLVRQLGVAVEPRELRLRTDQVGAGYGVLTPASAAAMSTAAPSHGLVLDPVYSARALAGLAAEVRDGSIPTSDSVVFLVTGGLPGLFGHPDTTGLRND